MEPTRIRALRVRRNAALNAQIALLEKARETYPLVLDRELALLRSAREALNGDRENACFEQVSRATPREQCRPIG
jgi:hypothetical protein